MIRDASMQSFPEPKLNAKFVVLFRRFFVAIFRILAFVFEPKQMCVFLIKLWLDKKWTCLKIVFQFLRQTPIMPNQIVSMQMQRMSNRVRQFPFHVRSGKCPRIRNSFEIVSWPTKFPGWRTQLHLQRIYGHRSPGRMRHRFHLKIKGTVFGKRVN